MNIVWNLVETGPKAKKCLKRFWYNLDLEFLPLDDFDYSYKTETESDLEGRSKCY